ncbi:hypothetical protein GCM10027066_25690 [Dyella jejuensis]
MRVPDEAVASALARAQAYVLEKQSPNGGFCFYRGYYLEEPSLADTWHGLAALSTLGAVPWQGDSHAAFVIAQPVEPQPFALYYRVRALGVLGVADPMAADVRWAIGSLQIRRHDPAVHASLTLSLQRLRCTLWLKQHFEMPFEVDEIIQALLNCEGEKGGYGTPPNVLDTEAAIGVLKLCNRPIASRTMDFVRVMAEPNFGFRLTAGALSPNLETTCAGVISCSRMDMPVPYAQAATAFILSCQTGNGGFGRSADALPDLALTHMALTTLIDHA